jgi:hypothetical protein
MLESQALNDLDDPFQIFSSVGEQRKHFCLFKFMYRLDSLIEIGGQIVAGGSVYAYRQAIGHKFEPAAKLIHSGKVLRGSLVS